MAEHMEPHFADPIWIVADIYRCRHCLERVTPIPQSPKRWWHRGFPKVTVTIR